MFTTPQSYNFLLCGHWLYNAKKHVLNPEVLNLQITFSGSRRTFKTVKTLMRTIMNEKQEEILEDSYNCFATRLYSIYITTSTDIPDILYEQNRNIILVTPFVPFLGQFDRPILSVSFKYYSLDLYNRYITDPLNKEILHKLTEELDSFAFIPNIEQLQQDEYYFEKLPLLELMINKEYHIIGRSIRDTILKQPYRIHFDELLAETGYIQRHYHFQNLILDDIKMFETQNILTVRLSMVIYRLAFWEFQENKSTIDKFYSQKLYLGNTVSIDCSSLSYSTRDLDAKSHIIGYDLRNLEIKQIDIARQLICTQYDRYDSVVDKDIIHEITTLSYETIDHLIGIGV